MENEKGNVNENVNGAEKSKLDTFQKDIELLKQTIARLTNKV